MVKNNLLFFRTSLNCDRIWSSHAERPSKGDYFSGTYTFADCCEYVNVYPTKINYFKYKYPIYWRSETASISLD
ncbi:protein of unknown function [Chryseobacterium sp. JV274]|nr:protein of unknown function [Chryseobacterium sp. JV274]